MSVSEPTVRIGAGLVLLVTGVVDLVTRHRTAAATTGDADAGDADAGDADAGDADGRDVVGVGGPADALAVLLRAPVPVVALSVGADHGVVLVAVVAALALAATGVRAVRSAWLARAVGAVGVLAGVALAVDGIYDV